MPHGARCNGGDQRILELVGSAGSDCGGIVGDGEADRGKIRRGTLMLGTTTSSSGDGDGDGEPLMSRCLGTAIVARNVPKTSESTDRLARMSLGRGSKRSLATEGGKGVGLLAL
jgi:hypothetical protein